MVNICVKKKTAKLREVLGNKKENNSPVQLNGVKAIVQGGVHISLVALRARAVVTADACTKGRGENKGRNGW